MSVVRRFVIAPSLVRLIRKERGGARITEGYFAPQGNRTSLVRIDGQKCDLVLISAGKDGAATEERTEVPRAHGEALLDVCAGKAAYDRTSFPVGAQEMVIDRYVIPAGLDLVSVTFGDEGAAKGFVKPAWLGAEVSTEAAYDRHAIALQGAPKAVEASLSNAALDALLDLLEPRFGLNRPAQAPASPPAPKPAAPAPAAPAAAAPPASVAAVAASEAAAKPAEAPAKPAVEAAAVTPAQPAKAPAEAVSTPAPPVLADTPPVPAKPPEPAAAPAPRPPAEAAAAQAAPPPAPLAAAHAEAAKPEPGKAEPSKPDDDGSGGDSRIDDVIESLSQALGAAIQQPREPVKDGDLDASFERWTVRPRRTQQ